MASGGYTGRGYGDPDETGYRVAGKVHEDEYVIPAWQRKDPWVVNVERVIEAHRKSKTFVSDDTGISNSARAGVISGGAMSAAPIVVTYTDERLLATMDRLDGKLDNLSVKFSIYEHNKAVKQYEKALEDFGN